MANTGFQATGKVALGSAQIVTAFTAPADNSSEITQLQIYADETAALDIQLTNNAVTVFNAVTFATVPVNVSFNPTIKVAAGQVVKLALPSGSGNVMFNINGVNVDTL